VAVIHFDAFDRYHHGSSRLHRLDPRLKVVAVMAYVLSNATLPDAAWIAFCASWVMLLTANLLAGLGPGYTFRRSFVVMPFVLAAVTVIFLPAGNPLAELQVGGQQLVVTDAGLIRFGSIAVRSWLSVQAAVLLVTVTQFPDLIHAFEHLRVPKVITTVVAFLYRYLFVLSDEVLRLLRGREARSAATPGRRAGGGALWRARVAGGLAGQLFLRSYDRSERIYQAMLARGYSGNLRTLNPHAVHVRDWALCTTTLVLLVLLQWLARR
jgi:cobalt/nickel transport system permease protein